MKRLACPAFTLALALSLGAATLFGQTAPQHAPAQPHAPTNPVAKIPIPPLRAFHPQEPRRVQLPNGAVLFLMEDHELPLIDFTAQFRGGSRDEPAAKVGLADIYGDVWRIGGTTSKTGDQVDDLLEAPAAKLETGSSSEASFISGDCLKGDFDTVFSLMLEFLQSPAFRQDKIDLTKDQFRTAISRRNDNVQSIANRESTMLAYGKNNPYAREAEYATVDAVTRADLAAWHAQYIHPGNMIFGIVGDFDGARMEAKLRQAFTALPSGPPYTAPRIAFQNPKPGVYFVEKDDVNQSQIRMVALGTERNNPDYFALTVMNEAFGGGFTSRLFANIRTRLGLAYDVGGAYGAGWDHPGIFRISTSTKSASTDETISALDDQVKAANTRAFTAEEVHSAKDALLNAFVFSIDSKDKILRERMTYEFYGYPADFLDRYRAGIDKASVDDVNRVAKKYVNRDKLAVLVVGNSKEFGKPLSAFGAVTPVDITIPEPATAIAAAAPQQSTPQGRALLAQALTFLGGQAKLAAVKSLHYTYSAKITTPQGALEIDADSWAVLPDMARQTMTLPQGQITTVITPTAMFKQMGDQRRDIPKSQAGEYTAGERRTPYYIARHAHNPAYVFATAPDTQLNGKPASTLLIHGEGVDLTWLIDPQSGVLLAQQYHATGPAGPVTRTESFSNYKPVNGIQVPFAITMTDNGKPFLSRTIHNYEIDPAVDPKLFAGEAPAAPAGSSK